jgi:SAM-dependent methyltransferase
MSKELAANWQRFTGFAEIYDSYRPPAVLADVLCLLAGVNRPTLVVDLGSGTGSSTRYWSARAEQVIGVEPSADMRRVAGAATQAPNVTFREGFSHATGLPDNAADIVTCSQSLHWMLPHETFTEAARILRPGGVFAAVDYDWPPLIPKWQAEVAYRHFLAEVRRLENIHHVRKDLVVADKSGHLERMKASGHFRFTRELMLHQIDDGSPERLVGLALSLGAVQSLMKAGLSEAEIGIETLRRELAEIGMATGERWYWTSRVRIGII